MESTSVVCVQKVLSINKSRCSPCGRSAPAIAAVPNLLKVCLESNPPVVRRCHYGSVPAIDEGSPDPVELVDRTRKQTGVISCVVDEKPRFHFEALRWFAALNRIAGVDPADLAVHVVGADDSAQLNYLRARGVSVKTVEGFDERHPHCNKISGALELATSTVTGLGVLTDTDIAVSEDPRSLTLPPREVASRIVVWPIPTVEVLTTIFEQADLELPPLVELDWPLGERTIVGNGNGGLYLIPGVILPRVVRAWADWARWLLERLHLFGQVKRRVLTRWRWRWR